MVYVYLNDIVQRVLLRVEVKQYGFLKSPKGSSRDQRSLIQKQ
jgi:hypothetical protein